MDPLTLTNIGAYSTQVMLLVGLATAVGGLLRLDVASVRYGYWRTVLAICLLLPLLQGRQLPATAEAAQSATVDVRVSMTEAVGAQAAPSIDWRAVVFPILAAGAVGRLLWLALNLVRLYRLRRAGTAAAASSVHSELCDLIGVRPEILYVDRLRQPVTFGLLRPVILLPSALSERSEDIQRAVISHELFHVKRRDWGWLVAEEIVCAVLWFNPAVWWLVSRVHLARELVVDELAVLATGRRRAYVAALMAFADETSLAPVAAFGGRAQLFDRIVLLSKESGMTARRLLFTLAVSTAALAAGTWQAVKAFPLIAREPQAVRQTAPGPLEQQAKPVTPENPIPRRTNFEAPFYPAEAASVGARGRVTLMITLDALGRIAEARRVGLTVDSTNPRVSVRFDNTTPVDEMRFLVNRSPEQSETLRTIAKAFEESAFRAVQGWRYEPPAMAPMSFAVLLTFSDKSDEQSAAQGSIVDTAPYGRGVSTQGAVRVGGNIKAPTKIKDVQPVYPPIAQSARVSGMVILEARVGADGSVEDARVLRSIPLLDKAAIDAVMQWRYTPTLLNGNPVPVVMTVTVSFTSVKGEVPREVVPEPVREMGGGGLVRDVRTSDAPVVVKEVKPRYTREMLDLGVQGSVEVAALIGADGRVMDAQVVHGDARLHESALAAIRQWEFKPLPEAKTVTIELTFSLRSKR
jgi:TonB family protein